MTARAATWPDLGNPDPQWRILLDLLVHESRERMVYLSSACVASGVPFTTALRMIKGLVSAGMVERVSDPREKRCVYLRLAPETRDRLIAHLRAEAERAAAVR